MIHVFSRTLALCLALAASVFAPAQGFPKQVRDLRTTFQIMDGKGSSSIGPLFSTGTPFTLMTSAQASTNPADPSADVGFDQILVAANGRIRVVSKGGTVGALDTTTNTFFNTVRGAQETTGARVSFDRRAQRWFVSMTTVGFPNRLLLAASNGPLINASTTWTLWGVVQDQVEPFGSFDLALTQTNLSSTASGLLICGNLKDSLGSDAGAAIFAIRKSEILSGGAAYITAFRSLGNVRDPIGVSNDEVGTTSAVAIANSTSGVGNLDGFRIEGLNSVPYIGSQGSLGGGLRHVAGSVPALGSTGGVYVQPQGFGYASTSLDKSTGQRFIWISQNALMNSLGGPASADRVGVLWYKLRDFGSGVPSASATGSVQSSAFPASHYWAGAVGVNGQSHLAALANRSSELDRIGLIFGFRYWFDDPSSIPVWDLDSGSVAYNPTPGSPPQPWNRDSRLVVDPSDDLTMWGFASVLDGANQWKYVAIRMAAPRPPAIVSSFPTTITAGVLTPVTITGQSGQTAGNFFQNDSSYPEQAEALLSQGAITNLSVFQNTITFNVMFSLGTLPGEKVFQWSNPDGQTSAGGAITVTVPKPTITAVSPDLVSRSPATEVTITGTSFFPGTVIEFAPYDSWIFAPKVTTYVNPTTVRAVITADDLKYGGYGQLRAINGPNMGDSFIWRVYVSVDYPAISDVKIIEGKPVRASLSSLLNQDTSYYTVEMSPLTGKATLEFTSSVPSFTPPSSTEMFFYAKLGGASLPAVSSAQIYNYSTKRWDPTYAFTYPDPQPDGTRRLEVGRGTRYTGSAYFKPGFGGPFYKIRVTFAGGQKDVRRGKTISVNYGTGRLIY